jgi:hypothetical protein
MLHVLEDPCPIGKGLFLYPALVLLSIAWQAAGVSLPFLDTGHIMKMRSVWWLKDRAATTP